MAELLLVAASGLAREVMALVRCTGQFDVLGILDDDPSKMGTVVDGAHILGPIDAVKGYRSARVVVCAGSGQVRKAMVARLARLGLQESRYASVVDPGTHPPEGCRIGHGSILLRRVTLTAAVKLGNHVVAMPGTTFTHDVVVEDYATFASGVSLGGGVHIGQAAYLGMNSSVRERINIGARAVIGMGSAVLAHVPDGETWVGVPARPLIRDGNPSEAVT